MTPKNRGKNNKSERLLHDKLTTKQWQTIVTDYCEWYVMKYFTTNLQQTAQTILQHIYNGLTTDYCERHIYDKLTTDSDRLLWKTILQQTYNRQWQTIVQTVTDYCVKLLWKICDEIFYNKLVDYEDAKINLTCLFYCYV